MIFMSSQGHNAILRFKHLNEKYSAGGTSSAFFLSYATNKTYKQSLCD